MTRPTLRTSLMLCVLLAGCAAVPRVTTLEERTAANRALSTVETVLIGLRAAGRVSAADMALAMAQITELRGTVQQSEFEPTDWYDVMLRVTAIGVAWIPPKD